MRRFLSFLGFAVFLGVAVAVMLPVTETDAARKTALRCPAQMTRVEVDTEDQARVDRNDNGFVCENPAGKFVDDNAAAPRKRRKKA